MVRSVFALLVVTMSGARVVRAQAPPDEAQIKAAFVYNFLKYVEWPPSTFTAAGDSLIVGVYGGGPTAEATARFLTGKLVNGRGVAVRRIRDEAAVTGMHAVFFGSTEWSHSTHRLEAIAAAGVLSIGECAGFTHRGGVIGLVIEAQKVRFEINTVAAATARIRVSSQLLALATLVPAGTPDPRVP